MEAHIEATQGDAAATVRAKLGRYCDHLHSLAAAQIFSQLGRSMRSGDVSFSQVNSLFRLYRHGPQRIGDLAAGVGVSPCAASRLVSQLVAEGLAAKQPNPASRRERLIRLTPDGLAFLKDLQRQTAAAYENVFQDVPPDLAGRLAGILEKILPILPPPELAE